MQGPTLPSLVSELRPSLRIAPASSSGTGFSWIQIKQVNSVKNEWEARHPMARKKTNTTTCVWSMLSFPGGCQCNWGIEYPLVQTDKAWYRMVQGIRCSCQCLHWASPAPTGHSTPPTISQMSTILWTATTWKWMVWPLEKPCSSTTSWFSMSMFVQRIWHSKLRVQTSSPPTKAIHASLEEADADASEVVPFWNSDRAMSQIPSIHE